MKHVFVSTVLVGSVLAATAQAQGGEEDWAGFQPSEPPVQSMLPPPEALPPPPLPPLGNDMGNRVSVPRTLLRIRPEVLARVTSQEERNTTSMLAAPTLGAGKRGQLLQVGFPVLSLRGYFGITDSFDLGLGVDSYYFMMNEPRLVARACFAKGTNWSFGASLEGGYAFFTQRASRESFGSRWWTGRRNINISPAVTLSVQRSRVRAARLLLELRYTLALDTEPYASDPLRGVPNSPIPGHNVALKAGAELPLSPSLALFFTFMLEVHGRVEDFPVTPGGVAGLITSF